MPRLVGPPTLRSLDLASLARNRYTAFYLYDLNRILTETSVPLQLFLGTTDKVYIVDKTENNPTPIHGHPAWAAGT